MSAPVEPAPPTGLVMLSAGAVPSAMQVRHLLRAAGGRPILWVAYARDLSTESGWRLREVRPLGPDTPVDELAHGEDDVDDAAPDLGPDDTADTADTGDSVTGTAGTAVLPVAAVPVAAVPVAAVPPVASGRAAAVALAQSAVRRGVKWVGRPAKRVASMLPPRWQDTLQKVLLGHVRGRGISSEQLANVLELGPLHEQVPELLIAADRHSAAAAWYVTQRHPQMTAVNGIDAGARYLEFAKANEAAGGRLDWQAVVGAGDEHDVLAALPPLAAARPRVAILATTSTDSDPRAALVARATASGCDVLVLRTAAPADTEFIAIEEDSVTVRVPGGPEQEAARAAILDELAPDLVVDEADGTAGTVELPTGPARTDAGVSLLVAPANYAGQSAAWARAVREHGGGAQARNLAVGKPDAPFAFPADFPLTSTEWRRPGVRARVAVEAVLPATHVLLEAMRPVLATSSGSEDADGWDFALGRADVDALLRSGRRVGLLFHGSEVRRPDRHRTEYAFSPFNSPAHAEATRRMTAATTRVHALLAGFEGPIFVSTLDLLDDVPEATWLPVVVGADCFLPAPPALQRLRPVVVHAPSNPFLKGTTAIEPVLKRLHGEGLIEYRRLDAVPSSFVTDFVREADVVVDQIVLGNPGVLAAESLAAGRLVVAHIAPHVRARFPVPPPIVEATPATFERVLRSVARDPARFRDAAGRGPAFAEQLHSGRLSAAVLAEFLDS